MIAYKTWPDPRADIFCRRIELMIVRGKYENARDLLKSASGMGIIDQHSYNRYNNQLEKIEEEKGLVLKAGENKK